MKKRRLLLLLGLGVALIAGEMTYRWWYLTTPEGAGPAGPNVAREPFAETWTDRKVLLLGVGDSITRGFGAPERLSYFSRLVENPRDEFPELEGLCLSAVLPNLRARNVSVSGSTSLDHFRLLQNQLEVQPADVFGLVVMTTGGNDLIHDYGRSPPREGAMYGATLEQAQPWIDAFRDRLDAMVDVVDGRFPGGRLIFLADVYDPTDGVGDAKNAGLPPWPDGLKIHAAYNRILHDCAAARSNVCLVPLHAEFLGHGIHCTQPWHAHYRRDDPTYWYAFNLEDPNHRGYDAIRRLFLIEIARSRQGWSGIEARANADRAAERPSGDR